METSLYRGKLSTMNVEHILSDPAGGQNLFSKL